MAHTDKDTPKRVSQMRKHKNGEIEHDHSRFGRVVEYTDWSNDPELSLTFPKSDTRSINTHRMLLRALADKVTYTERVIDPYRLGYYGFDLEAKNRPEKEVEFKVKRRHVRKYTNYCTDFEHYDAQTDTDTRDGGRVVCNVSMAESKQCRCHYCIGGLRSSTKNQRRGSFIDAAKAYNSGAGNEEVESRVEDI